MYNIRCFFQYFLFTQKTCLIITFFPATNRLPCKHGQIKKILSHRSLLNFLTGWEKISVPFAYSIPVHLIGTARQISPWFTLRTDCIDSFLPQLYCEIYLMKNCAKELSQCYSNLKLLYYVNTICITSGFWSPSTHLYRLAHNTERCAFIPCNSLTRCICISIPVRLLIHRENRRKIPV
jgi:hypothetical protein